MVFITILYANLLFAQSQTSLIIHLKEGSTAEYYLTDIDSITFSETVKDFDGNIYQTITIGDQIWMAKNLKVTHYRNGDPIPNVSDDSEWENLFSGAYCYYNNNSDNALLYGHLYNWYATTDTHNLAPEGWHVATDDDWKELEVFLGMTQGDVDGTGHRGTDEGGKLKETGTDHWTSPNIGATNESGFTALPGGWRYKGGTFYGMYDYTYFWTTTEYDNDSSWHRGLWYDDSKVERNHNWKQLGFSIRCVKD